MSLTNYQHLIIESIKEHDFIQNLSRMTSRCHNALLGEWVNWWFRQKSIARAHGRKKTETIYGIKMRNFLNRTISGTAVMLFLIILSTVLNIQTLMASANEGRIVGEQGTILNYVRVRESPQGVLYKDEEKYFEILIPPEWRYASDVKFNDVVVDLVLYGPTEDGFIDINIIIISGSDQEVKETETYLINTANKAINVFYSQYTNLQVIQSPMYTTINEYAAVNYLVQYQHEGFTIRMKQALIVSDEMNYCWSITATALEKSYEKYEPIVNSTIESFKVLPPREGGGISGFPYESIILGVVGGVFLLWLIHRARACDPSNNLHILRP